jgi:hypothetical protein
MTSMRLLLIPLFLLGAWALYSPPSAQAECRIVDATPTYTAGQLKDHTCDTSGLLQVEVSGGLTALGTSTAAAPSLVEGEPAAFSFDLAGNARFTMGTLLAGEDQPNNLLMTSGGNTRQLLVDGSASVPTTDGTSTTYLLPVGNKTFQAILTCTGTCIQVIDIWGSSINSTDTAKASLLCTLTLNQATTASKSCLVSTAWAFYFNVRTSTGGTTPLMRLFANF